MKILFVHEVSYRNKVIFEMHEFPEMLALRGHEVTYFNFDEGAKFWSGGLTPRNEIIRGRVFTQAKLRLIRPLQVGIPGVDRVLATVTSRFALRNLLKVGAFDAVVLLAVPTFGLQTLSAARKARTPVVFRALDVSHKIRENILGSAIKAIEKRIYRSVDLVLGNNPVMTSYCIELGRRTKPARTLLAPVDLLHFAPRVATAELRRSLGIQGSDSVITYVGTFFYFSGLDEIIKEFAAAVQAGKANNVKLLLIGSGEQDAELRKLVAELGLTSRVIFTGFIPYAMLPEYLSLSTLAVNPLKKSLVTDKALPHKVLQYLALGLPVVSTPLAGLKAVFGDSAGIRWADNPREVLESALAFSGETAGLIQAGARARAIVAERLSVDGTVDQLEQVLKELSAK